MSERLSRFSSRLFASRDAVPTPSLCTSPRLECCRCEEVELLLNEVHHLLLDGRVKVLVFVSMFTLTINVQGCHVSMAVRTHELRV